ncbi:ABC transporter ATP-binding protein [Cesiribacter sp. SM1]|uniref:ABC transporter ATP-binding protein n=1 Tax=Cesiribacter sp. SM1 TaxID=2861196 RepID=UPI001CD6C41A|nr:ABC transporter ATP-binding protein [Cesiribacter sp. SM1]
MLNRLHTGKLQQEVLLEVKNLQTHYQTPGGVIRAVDGIDFSIRKGETLGIVGESGSGKSVTALSLLQLLGAQGKSMEGEAIFQSRQLGPINLLKATSQQMRQIRGNEISIIFQEPMTSLNPVYTCGNQVMETILLHRRVSHDEARRQTLALFDRVQLPKPERIFKAYPHQLSGGQKQRVMIAMALSCDPQLVIADEPTTALDVTVQSSILKLMAELRDDINTAVMFITHDLGVIAEVADRVMVMWGGKAVEEADVLDIFSRPKHPYTKGLLACRPRLDMTLKVLPTITDFVALDSSGQLIERPDARYHSVGEALLMNVETTEEINKRHLQVLKNTRPLLEINELKVEFDVSLNPFKRQQGKVTAVDGVSFKVYPGETLGLVGESGCGKTSLGRSILRLMEPSSGEIIFDGQNIRKLSNRDMRLLRRQMQIIFQDPYASLNPRQTIGSAIMEPMQIHKLQQNDKQRRERVMYLLERVGLQPDQYHRYPHEFSGGQRQRICIARTLALEPRFIICDESVSALDVSVQAQVLNLLNELKNDFGLTYIFISHDLSVVKFMADRIMVMQRGKIVETGYPEQMFEHPRDEYTRSLIKAIPRGDLEDIRKAQLARMLARKAG